MDQKFKQDEVEERPEEMSSCLLTSQPSTDISDDPDEKPQWRSALWRVINLIMAVFFAMAAYVQLNDPDPYLWMFVYSVPGTLCLAIFFSVNSQDYLVWQSLATANVVGSLAGAIYLATLIKPEIRKHKITNPLVLEEGREMAGLLISMLWISICKIVSWCSQRKSKLSLAFWILIVLVCLVPFTLWVYCYRTLEPSALPGHCKDML